MKGISPVLAAILLIAFLLSIAVLAAQFFTGFLKEEAKEVKEFGLSSGPCFYTNLELYQVYYAEPNLSLTVMNRGRNDLTGLTGWAFLADGSTVSHFFNETLAQGSVKTFVIPGVTKPFEKIRFWGNACPEYKIKKEYKWEEVNISGQGEAVIANDGDVIFSPTIIISA
jgi:flagellin-like protein